MATFPQKTDIATAVTSRSTIPVNDRHVSTTNFMELGVAKILELAPKGAVDMDMRTFARFETMTKPTQGDAMVNTRCYFVPFRTIMRNFDKFDSDVPFSSVSEPSVVSVNSVHFFYNYQLAMAFISTDDSGFLANSEFTTVVDIDVRFDYSSNYDIVMPWYVNSQWKFFGLNFTDKGARIYKLLTQLGYAIDFSFRLNEWYPSLNRYVGNPTSAMPLLALLKIYTDHYYPSQYALTKEYMDVIKWFDYDGILADAITTDEIRNMFNLIDNVCYSNDYFVSAWDNPNSPNDNSFSSSVVIQDISGADLHNNSISTVDTTAFSDGTPAVNANGATYSLTQYALTALKSLTDYMKRHQIVGARVIDRYLSRWGIVLPDAKLNRSVYIDNTSQPVIFGDVTSTADTEGANLGSYAGKGVIPEKNSSFSFYTDERGYFIILSSVVPVVGYYQGRDPIVNHIERFDFFTPEFDNLGVQAIRTNELFVPLNSYEYFESEQSALYALSAHSPVKVEQSIFGFNPRYAEYKVGRDKLSGDFRLSSRNTGMDAWHLFRDVSPFFNGKNYSEVSHDIDFIKGLDSRQYNRIFNYMGEGMDMIKIFHYFNYKITIAGKKLYDTYEFTDEDKAQHVSVDVGGSKAN